MHSVLMMDLRMTTMMSEMRATFSKAKYEQVSEREDGDGLARVEKGVDRHDTNQDRMKVLYYEYPLALLASARHG